MVAQLPEWLEAGGALAALVVALVSIVASVGAVIRWLTRLAIGDVVAKAVQPTNDAVTAMRADVDDLKVVAGRLDTRLTAHLDSENAANEAWASDWKDFREQHTEDVRTLHARIDQALARAVHPSSWGLTHADDDE